MRFQNVLMDFDGTVARSGDGIINGVKYACTQMGYTEGSPWEDWRRYIGPTVYRFTTDILGLSEEGRDQFMALYTDYYKRQGIYEGPLYPGMGELIANLRAGGAKVYVCSSKPEELTLLCIDYLKLAFDGVGAMLPGRVKKNEVMDWCVKEFSIDPAVSAMVGDRDSDVLAGKQHGMAGIGVSYGYGTEEELREAGADFIAHSVEELRQYLLG